MPPPENPACMSGTAAGVGPTDELSLGDRIVAIVSMRGYAGITRDELLRRPGVAHDDLMAVLDQLQARHLVRVDWPTEESFGVFCPR